MKGHHARGPKETVFNMPVLVSTGRAGRRPSTCLRKAGVSDDTTAENTSELAWAECRIRHRLPYRSARDTKGTRGGNTAFAGAIDATTVGLGERPVRGARC
jgi:hypothetical protein